MIETAQELEERISFYEERSKAARLLLDASYAAAEAGTADESVLQMMRLAADRILDLGYHDWTLSHIPAPNGKFPWQ